MVMMVFCGTMTGIILSESFYPGRISVGRVTTAMVGLLFVFLGNMMPKMKNNFFMGIRTPWTLSDPDVWNRTHRLGGILWFAGGLLTVALALCGISETLMFVLLMVLVAVLALVPTVYSYLCFRAKGQANGE